MTTEEIQPTTNNAISGTIDKPYALLAGLQLDLFTALEDGPLTVDELARVVQGDAQRLSGLVYFLVGAGLLTVADGRFANTPEADRWLVRGRPGSYVNYEGFRSGLSVRIRRLPSRSGRGTPWRITITRRCPRTNSESLTVPSIRGRGP